MSIDLNKVLSDTTDNKKKINLFKEIILFILFNSTVFVIGMIIINLQAFKLYFIQYFGQYLGIKEYKTDINIKYVSMGTVQQTHNKRVTNVKKFRRQIKQKYDLLKQIQNKLLSIKKTTKVKLYYKDLSKYLLHKKQKIKFVFNLLPPDKRIVIPSIGVNAPIVDLKFVSDEKLAKADFDEELYHGVVKYPYTPDPGQTGNILIFGHTSYYWWKHNPYGDVFAKIPLLKHGDIIEIIWNGKVYKYKVFKKLIRRPWQVKATYNYYNTGKNLTLMGCYPIGTDRQRMMIIAKQVDTIGDTILAYKQK